MSNRKWTWRLAVGLSLLWVLGMFFLTESSDTFRLFLLVGVLPIVAVWLAYWVFVGFRQERQDASRGSRMRLRWRK